MKKGLVIYYIFANIGDLDWLDGRVVMQRTATPCTPVRFRLQPPFQIPKHPLFPSGMDLTPTPFGSSHFPYLFRFTLLQPWRFFAWLSSDLRLAKPLPCHIISLFSSVRDSDSVPAPVSDFPCAPSRLLLTICCPAPLHRAPFRVACRDHAGWKALCFPSSMSALTITTDRRNFIA